MSELASLQILKTAGLLTIANCYVVISTPLPYRMSWLLKALEKSGLLSGDMAQANFDAIKTRINDSRLGDINSIESGDTAQAIFDAMITRIDLNRIPERKLSYLHFHPISSWKADENGPMYSPLAHLSKNNDGMFGSINTKRPRYIIDSKTGDHYNNEYLWVIWIKHSMLAAAGWIVHALAALYTVIVNSVKLLSFYHFWKATGNEHKEGYDFKNRSLDAMDDVFHILFAPISVLLLECSALYGLMMPLNGRKLYANLEMLTYSSDLLAPCFQPEAKSHFFGGDIDSPNAF